MKPDQQSSVCFTSYSETPKGADCDEKWMCSWMLKSFKCPAACTPRARWVLRVPCSPAPLPLNPQQGYAALQSPRWGVTYETQHPRIPHVPDHSARLAKLPPLCSHYPFNFPLLHGVSFLLLKLIRVQSIITPRGIG